jgi:hypothetical protein
VREWRLVGSSAVVTVPAQDAFAEIVGALGDERGVMRPDPGASASFGAAALRVDGRIFAMVSRGRLVMKLPAARVAELIVGGDGEPYDAGKGRPMKEWVAFDPRGNRSWVDLATEALDFVRSAR